MQRSILLLIRCYQKALSPDQGFITRYLSAKPTCTMYPSCSEYVYLAVERYGAMRGLYKGFFRILRCHPYQKKLIDEP